MEVQGSEIRRQSDGDRESAEERAVRRAPVPRHLARRPRAHQRSGRPPMKSILIATLLVLVATTAAAQADLSGVWAPYRGGRGADPALAPPPATPIVLKPQYAAPFEMKRKADADAAAKGEPIASGAVACVPYGMPRTMSVALYPIEILPTS